MMTYSHLLVCVNKRDGQVPLSSGMAICTRKTPRQGQPCSGTPLPSKSAQIDHSQKDHKTFAGYKTETKQIENMTTFKNKRANAQIIHIQEQNWRKCNYYVPYIPISYTKHTVPDISNVCSDCASFKQQWTRI